MYCFLTASICAWLGPVVEDWFADLDADTDEPVACAAPMRMIDEYLTREL